MVCQFVRIVLDESCEILRLCKSDEEADIVSFSCTLLSVCRFISSVLLDVLQFAGAILGHKHQF